MCFSTHFGGERRRENANNVPSPATDSGKRQGCPLSLSSCQNDQTHSLWQPRHLSFSCTFMFGKFFSHLLPNKTEREQRDKERESQRQKKREREREREIEREREMRVGGCFFFFFDPSIVVVRLHAKEVNIWQYVFMDYSNRVRNMHKNCF